MNVQHTVANDEFCSDEYHESIDCVHRNNRNSSPNVVSIELIREKKIYNDAIKRAAAVADTLDW
ncbi:hypothetical protein ACLH3X_003406 [Proteus mirabilis]|nr:hypothetical protein [Proteus mirabilis]ELA7948811.1 hypothetical protein [Proteus mirabilis]MBG3047916.1 hypothetical protein [Proteus mirabilis]MBG6021309.1 hypothetical protein [Proteus mirabilis]MBI6269317.1 hypothetical protein [Proteus mirabilis]MBI6302613.1 hypothetical protein [Proteus mirabilis]